MSPRRRLDSELVRRGLAESQPDAERLIGLGRVRVQGARADKATRMVAPGDAVVVDGPPARFVGRGGEKLDHALELFGIDVRGRRAADIGASTGGFTDCLLQRGAASVLALDVGHGQLDQRLRLDDRVCVVERMHVNDALPASLDGPFDIVVVDVSFISLTKVAAAIVRGFARPGADIVALVKPQFEVTKAVASRGKGVVTDADERSAAVGRVSSALEASGATIMGVVDSPITGASGNQEYLLYAHRPEA
ncbi:MAG: TlyA family RNA methyltransferase [Acidimicrobiales bacterium]|nr:TlyA family RNA methyltransferase [Acidimicrobiales bacterium]